MIFSIGANAMKGDSLIESEIMSGLSELGIQFASNFRIGAGKGEEFCVDLMITFPVRALVEIKSPVNLKKDKLIQTFRKINKRYFGTLLFFIIDLSDTLNNENATEKNIHIIHPPKGEKKIGIYCAQKIEDFIFKTKRIQTSEKSINDLLETSYVDTFKININNFEEVLISLSTCITPKDYRRVVDEVSELNAEITARHYTSAALRIGRTIEYVVYTLATAWDVKINRLSSSIIDDLDQSNAQLKKLIVEYFYSTEDEKDIKKNNLSKQCQKFSSKITSLGFQIDDLEEPQETNQPLNLQTIIRDIKRKFSHIKEAREIIDNLLNGASLSYLSKMRNNAAHARVLESHQDLDADSIETMISHLRLIMFDLVNLAAIVQNNKTR